MIELYWASGSCKSWAVRLALAAKRIPYDSKLLDLSKREHKTPEYLALNPRGKVPCLREGEYVLYESLAILAHLDRRYPDPPLYGETAAEAGRIVRVASEFHFYIEPALDALILPFYRGKVAEHAHELSGSAEAVHQELGRLEALLGEGDHLIGQRLSAADVVVFPGLQHLWRVSRRPDFRALDLGFQEYAERYPRLAAWNARIEAIPGYELTYPPHWR